MVELPDGRCVGVHREDSGPAPQRLQSADDRTSAKVALALLREGTDLVWTGDWHNGRQLLAALRRRVRYPRDRATELADRWHEERAHTRRVAELLGRVWVVVGADGRLDLRRAPDTAQAVAWAFGEAHEPRLIPLPTVIGALGAAGWTREGLSVPGLEGTLEPRFGVFSPTRHAYVGLLDALDFEDKVVLDTGAGTGVLGFVALQRGARRVMATDIEPRAVACAAANALRLGLAARYQVASHDLFWPAAQVDLALFNPPWLPETPRTRLDRAVFDDGSVVQRWLAGLSQVLLPRGQGALLVSDLAVRLGLRQADELPAWIEREGLAVAHRADAPATHRKARDPRDPLHVARAAERVQLWVLEVRSG